MENSFKKGEYKILVFTLDELACALNISSVVRVIRSMEISKLPKAPEIIKGTISYKGQIIPVVDIRKRFGHLRRGIGSKDRIIIADTGKRKVAFFVDSVSEIKEQESCESEFTAGPMPHEKNKKEVSGIGRDILRIHDLEQFLSYDEEKALEVALIEQG
jgi:purine-binding chemotaxis protein CheW